MCVCVYKVYLHTYIHVYVYLYTHAHYTSPLQGCTTPKSPQIYKCACPQHPQDSLPFIPWLEMILCIYVNIRTIWF